MYMDMKPKINILWTGGLDSTYRVLELSQQDVTIQPYYLASVNPSTQYELNAITELTESILKRPETKCELLPLIVVNAEQIKPNDAITKAWERLHEMSHLGSQYDFIARLAAQYNLVLELGIEKDPHESTIQRCIMANGGAMREGSSFGGGYITANCESKDMCLVFENMRFPLPLFDMTKQDEIAQYKLWHAEEVLSKVWFCYHPVDGKPCGLCDPCKTYIEVGLGSMIPKNRLRLYKFRKNHAAMFDSLKSYKRKLKGLKKAFK